LNTGASMGAVFFFINLSSDFPESRSDDPNDAVRPVGVPD